MQTTTLSDLTILLVEPSNTQRKLILQQLEQEQVGEIRCVSQGEDALSDALAFAPDLVISAMYLPDMSAVDLVTRIRNETTICHLPFMLISSETRFRELDPIRQAGVIAILPKPFSHEQLKTALLRTLEHVQPTEADLHEKLLANTSILVVDDSQLSRKHIQRVLQNLGFQKFTEATNGKEALTLLQLQSFDLIVSDLNMPEMDGQALVEAVRNSKSLQNVPILMVTSEENQSRLANVQQAGVSALCDKPFDQDVVRQIVQNLLASTN